MLSLKDEESEAQRGEVTCLRTQSRNELPDLWTMGPVPSRGRQARGGAKDGGVTLRVCFTRCFSNPRHVNGIF